MPSPSSTFTPTADPTRIPAIDILRGCAVMGILWMNIGAFALPVQAYLDPVAAGPMSAADIVAWLVGLVLVDGKMRALFSMLFGASMLLLIDKAEMAGRDGRRAQLVRAGWLFAFGLAHYLLLWWGDILMTYAVVGLIALPFARAEPLTLLKWAFLAFLLHFLVQLGFIAGLHAWSQDASPQYQAFIAALSDPADPAIRQEILLYRSGFGAIVAHQLAGYPGEWLRGFMFTSLDTLGFMLMGMAMLKGGFLTGRWDADHYRRTARHCFLIGLPPMLALGIWVILSGFAPLATLGVVMAWSFPFRIPLAVGWAALILTLAARHRGHALTSRIAAAGRLALSNYLGTSLVMTAIFHGWGLGMFARFGHAALLAFVLGAWALMLLWSPWWLSRFALGPLEWLWRSLARGKMQTIRRSH